MAQYYPRTCDRCEFCAVRVVRGHEALTCHRYAPRPLNGGSGEGWADYEWPIVAAKEFCGEFVPSEEQIVERGEEGR